MSDELTELREKVRVLEAAREAFDTALTRVLSERVAIEDILAAVGAGKLPPLSPRDCQVLAIRLGTPKSHWSDVIKSYKLEGLN